jgi:UDP-N-acetylglucosamine--N-acetylmuramyl-(pentapeptide) pyrophosphoryl-undecaprenol N-acetylglucosamine transferase
MAGGTGGHVFPALAVAERLRAEGVEVFWIGTHRGMEARLVPQHGFDMEWIGIEGLRGKGIATLALAPVRLTAALWQAARILRRRRPAAVLGMGGFASGPGGLMARVLGLPLVIHEQNRVPGLTNQWLSRVAARVFEAFPGSFPPARHAEACGNPVRAEIAALAPPEERLTQRLEAPGPRRVLVLGGSLGARALNRILPLALALIPADLRPEVRHQAGERTVAEAEEGYARAGIVAKVTPFIADMSEAYAWADLAVCRAGALTISELAAAGLAAILVPYPHAVDDHQTGNASFLVQAGAARLLPQSELTPDNLAAHLTALLADPAVLLTMAQAARAKAQPDAAARVAAACREVQSRHNPGVQRA